MKKKYIRSLLGIMISVVIAVASVPHVYAKEVAIPGTERVDEMVRVLIKENQKLAKVDNEVYEDLILLESLGLSAEMIKDTEISGDKIIYTYEFLDKYVNEIMIDETDNGIIMNASQGKISNELLLNNDGTIFLDGNEIIIEEQNVEEKLTDSISQSTGGWYWYEAAKASSKLKNAKYNAYPSSPTSKCANIPLQKAIRNIAVSVVVGLLVNYITGGTGAITLANTAKDGLAGIVGTFVTNDPNTKELSAKYYVAKCKDNSRYRRKKCIIYSKKNFQTSSNSPAKTTIEYGLMM